MTFTNKAAREMKERVGHIVGGAVEGMPWLGTFHSIGMRILRRHAELVGLKPNFTILDADDQIRLIKQIIQAEGSTRSAGPRGSSPGSSTAGRTAASCPKKCPRATAFSFANGRGIELYAAYQKRLKELNAVDFGDLLLENLRLFMENPDVLDEYHRRFPTSWSTSIRTPTSRNISGCGCSRRGTAISAASATTTSPSMAGAARKWTTSCASRRIFPARMVIRLEHNYRSTGHILGAASEPDRAQSRPPRQDLAHEREAMATSHRARRLGRRGRSAHRRRGHRAARARGHRR